MSADPFGNVFVAPNTPEDAVDLGMLTGSPVTIETVREIIDGHFAMSTAPITLLGCELQGDLHAEASMHRSSYDDTGVAPAPWVFQGVYD